MSACQERFEVSELALDHLVIEQYQAAAGSRVVGKTIGQLEIRSKTGASIVALIEPDGSKKNNPGADSVILVGSTLVIAGERRHLRAFHRVIWAGSS
jgi:TrkA domain protein